MIKLIAVDMDGTLLNSQKEMIPENIEALQRAAAAGVKIVLCTGRPRSGIKPYFDQIGLTGEEYIIMNNGCSIYKTPNWDLLSYESLNKEELQRLNRVCADNPDICLTLTAEKNYYALASEVPDLVAYDASLVFDQAKARSVEELSKRGRSFFKLCIWVSQLPWIVFKKRWTQISVRIFRPYVASLISMKLCLEVRPRPVL